mgnify:CR=1 FL=1
MDCDIVQAFVSEQLEISASHITRRPRQLFGKATQCAVRGVERRVPPLSRYGIDNRIFVNLSTEVMGMSAQSVDTRVGL